MNIDLATATVITGIAGATGAIVAGGITLINAWLIRRSEERRQIRELAVRAAIEEWTKHIEITEGHRTKIPPLDLYLIHAMYFVQTLDGSLRTKEEIRNHLRKVHSITDAAGQEIEEYSKNPHNENSSQPTKLTQPEKELDILKLLSVQTEAVSSDQIAQWLPIPMDKDDVEYYLDQLHKKNLIRLSSLFIPGIHHPGQRLWVITDKGRKYLRETKPPSQPGVPADG